MRIYILVNVLNHVDSFIYSNHIAFFCKTKEDFPKSAGNDIFFFTPPRMSIDMARNIAAREALKLECDYLMFIDDDVAIPPDALTQLINCDADIAAGLVIIRGYPFNVMAFKRESGNIPYFNDLPKVDHEGKKYLKNPVTQDDGLAAVGFSCALIKCSLLRKITPPFFLTGPRHTEDIYFCLKAHETITTLRTLNPEEPELKIALNTNVQPGHFLHAEPIEYKTIDVFKEFYETLDPKIKITVEELDRRDLDYITQNTQHLG